MEIHELNLRHLRAFAKTYELGSLLAASRAINITQPAITQGIARLEDQLQTKLFFRQPDGAKPTEAAKMLFPRAVAALGLFRSTRITHAQVRALLSLAKHGGYVEASHATGLARPSLHRALGDLEKAIGKELVQRRGRGIELTNTGRQISRNYRLAHAELRAGLDEIRALQVAGSGQIAIGAMPLCRARVLPDAIVAFRRLFPHAELSISEGSRGELLEPLRNGDLDFMVGALRSSPIGQDLTQLPLFEDRPAIIARKNHPLTDKAGKISLDDLAQFEWCLPPEGVPLRDRWREMFESAGQAAPTVWVECGSGIAIRQMLLQTDYLTLLSPDQVSLELNTGLLDIVGDTPATMSRTIGMTSREGWRPTLLQAAFIDLLKQAAISDKTLPLISSNNF